MLKVTIADPCLTNYCLCLRSWCCFRSRLWLTLAFKSVNLTHFKSTVLTGFAALDCALIWERAQMIEYLDLEIRENFGPNCSFFLFCSPILWCGYSWWGLITAAKLGSDPDRWLREVMLKVNQDHLHQWCSLSLGISRDLAFATDTERRFVGDHL